MKRNVKSMKKLQVLPIIIIIISLIGLLPISLKMMSNYAPFYIINKDSQQLIHTSTESAPLIDWDPNGTVICNARHLQGIPQLVSDGAGGAIITWGDCRNVFICGPHGTIRIGGCDIYAQRINSTGDVQWTVNGIIVCNANGDQFGPQLVSDGAGGAIIIWQDCRDGLDIYAQRVNFTGDVQWTANGTVICNASSQQYFQLVSDGAGGAIIAWQDNRDVGTTGTDIYTQRVSSTGDVQWTVNGTAICMANGDQLYPQLISDGAGGAIIVWQDNRDMETTETNIYAQWVSSNGDIQWIINGTIICIANGDQSYPQLVSDGVRGAIITWQDNRDVGTTGTDIYTQRIGFTGNVQWTANGIPICTANYNQGKPQLVSDGVGGAIIVWQHERSKIYTQRIGFTGNVQWTANGVLIRKSSKVLGYSKFESLIQLVSDGVGGAIIIWEDNRDAGTTGIKIYTQRISFTGNVQWTANGIVICNASSQQYPQLISDGAGGVIIAWQDYRSESPGYVINADIYAQRIFESLPKISFGYFYLLFTLFSIIVLTFILKKKILKENNFISKY